MNWLQAAQGLGVEVSGQINKQALINYFTDLLGVPDFLVAETSNSLVPKNSETQ